MKPSYDPKDYPHPGKVLLSELEEIGLSQGTLAKYISVSPDLIEGVVAGKKSMTALLACKLSAALGGGPRKWMELQVNHDLTRVPASEYETIRQLGGKVEE